MNKFSRAVFKDTLKIFNDFKAKKCYEVMFFDMQKYLYSESVFNTLYNEIKQKYEKKFLRTK